MIYLPILYTGSRERECAAPCFMARMNINERVRHRASPIAESGAPRVLLARSRYVRACMQIYIELSVLQLAEIQRP